MAENEKLLADLRRVHPELMKNGDEYCFFRATYEGGKDYVKDNLFSHRRENESDFEWRIQRAYYLNVCAPMINVFNGFLKGAEKISNLPFAKKPTWDAFMSDASGSGETLEELESQARLFALTEGKSYIMLDRRIASNEMEDGKVLTKADEMAAGS